MGCHSSKAVQTGDRPRDIPVIQRRTAIEETKTTKTEKSVKKKEAKKTQPVSRARNFVTREEREELERQRRAGHGLIRRNLTTGAEDIINEFSQEVTSLGALARYMEKLPILIDVLAGPDSTPEIRSQFHQTYDKVKNDLNPYNRDAGYQEASKLNEEAQRTGRGTKEALNHLQAQMTRLGQTPESKAHDQLFGVCDDAFRPIWLIDAEEEERVDRARGKAKANNVFNRFAGKTTIEGLEVDAHGNASGADGGLVPRGAFVGYGMKIVVIQQYVVEEFDFSHPKKVLHELGMELIHYTGKDIPRPDTLDNLLANVNQFWLISGERQYLTQAHVNVIVKHWKRGLGMYIWGDNDPFSVDANQVLDAMNMPTMKGNYPGQRKVHPTTRRIGTKKGFLPHDATTGIQTLYEGYTIAEFEPATVKRCGCEEILWDHEGHLTVIYRKAQGGCGPLIASGCFTQLYMGWDTAGSPTFVRNCTALLAVSFSDGAGSSRVDLSSMDFVHAPKMVCDVEYVETDQNGILVSVRGDPNRFLSEFCQKNALGFGRIVYDFFSPQVYQWDAAQRFLNAGSDPFLSRPVTAILPIVDLGQGDNQAILLEALKKIFMDGRGNLNETPWLLYYAACDWMYGNTVDHPEMWQYLMEQMEKHCKVTSFIDGNRSKKSLGLAIKEYVGTLTHPARMTMDFGSIMTMLRYLHRTGKKTPDQLQKIARNAAIRHIIISLRKQYNNGSKTQVARLSNGPVRGLEDLRNLVDDFDAFQADLERMDRLLELEVLPLESLKGYLLATADLRNVDWQGSLSIMMTKVM